MRLLSVSFLCLLILVACTSKKDELTSRFVSKEQGRNQIYVIYSDNSQMNSSPMEEKVMKIVRNHVEKVVNISSMYDVADVKKEFEIKEYPTILVFNTDKLVLQTTDSDKLDELLSK